MTSQEAMIFQLKKLKGRPFLEIMIHIVTYFWVPIVIVTAVLVLLVSMVVTRVTQKEPALTVCCINAAAQQDAAAYEEQFAQNAGIDLSEYEITILTNLHIDDSDTLTAYQSNQILMSMVAAESLDVIVADQETALQCMYADYCVDLSQVLTDTQMAWYRQYFLYMDMDYLSQLQNTETLDGQMLTFPDPTKPEEMVQPVPVALRLSGDSEFVKLLFPYSSEVVLSVAANSQNMTNALMFLEYACS